MTVEQLLNEVRAVMDRRGDSGARLRIARAVYSLLSTPPNFAWPDCVYVTKKHDGSGRPPEHFVWCSPNPIHTPAEARALAVAILKAADEAGHAAKPDFVDEVIAERTAKNPKFPAMVAKAEAKRKRKAKP